MLDRFYSVALKGILNRSQNRRWMALTFCRVADGRWRMVSRVRSRLVVISMRSLKIGGDYLSLVLLSERKPTLGLRQLEPHHETFHPKEKSSTTSFPGKDFPCQLRSGYLENGD